MDPTPEGPGDSDHRERTDGHLSTQPLYEDSLHGDEQAQINLSNDREFGPEQETPLLVFLRTLPKKTTISESGTIPVSSSVNDNDIAVAVAVNFPGDTVDNTVGDAPPDSIIGATIDLPAGPTTPASRTSQPVAGADIPIDSAGHDTDPDDIDLPLGLQATLKTDVNIRSLEPGHETPLHVAVHKGHMKVIKRLIDAKADLNASDESGVQPLHIACDKGNEDLIALFLDNGATTMGPDRDGWCLLHYASYYDMDAGLLQRLIEVDREHLDTKESFEGWTPINRATWFGRQSVVDALLKAGVDLGIADKNGWTPMMTAIDEGNFEVFDMMVDHLARFGSDGVQVQEAVIDQRDDEGMTVLMTLCDAEPSPASEASLRNFLEQLRPSTHITDNIDQTALDHAMALAKTSDNHHAQNIALEMIKWWPEQALLRQNMANETAFDDVSGPLLDALVSRLKDDLVMRDKLLCWLASKSELHNAIAVDILSKLKPREPIDALDHKDEWTLVDWAIYHRKPRVMLNCSALDNFGSQIIDELKEWHPDSKKKRNTSRKDELNPRKVLDEMGDILNFLPQMRTKNPNTRWKVSRSTEDMNKCLGNYNAAVVRFRQRELDAFRFRKVDKIVYDDEPISVITLGQIEQSDSGEETAADSAKQDLADTESTFMWIHLPATNMDWMKNTVMKIMKTQSEKERGYQEKLASFLQASWVQVPDKTSASRFMRPRYVRMPQEGLTTDTHKTQKKATALYGVRYSLDGLSKDDGKVHISNNLQCPASALYMPFLVVSQYHEGEGSKQHNHTAPQSSGREHLFSAYKDSVIHDSPTLDEHYYHFAEDKDSAEDRKERNRSQVISKYLSPNADESDTPRTILRVSQLWAWTIGDKWLVTSTSCAKVEKASAFVEDIREHLRRRTDDGNLNGGLRSPQELGKVIAEYCVGSYERKHKLETRRSELPAQDQKSISLVRSQIPLRIEKRSIRQVVSDFINEIVGLVGSKSIDQLPLSFLTSLFAFDVESFLGAPWWSLVVILTVPLPFLLVAVGYMYDWDIRKFSRRGHDGANQPDHPANKMSGKSHWNPIKKIETMGKET